MRPSFLCVEYFLTLRRKERKGLLYFAFLLKIFFFSKWKYKITELVIKLRFNRTLRPSFLCVEYVLTLRSEERNGLIIYRFLTLNQLDRAIGWWNFNTLGTPDYFNICRQNQPATVPSDFSYELPLSNDGYIHSGILTAHKPSFFATCVGNPYGFVFGGSDGRVTTENVN